ncbi:MAG TPA: hypothetical protein VGP62_22195 [Bryobacteraceae bacterium]|nr:hypothetical protein [Bryobacteraceae bacterium]
MRSGISKIRRFTGDVNGKSTASFSSAPTHIERDYKPNRDRQEALPERRKFSAKANSDSDLNATIDPSSCAGVSAAGAVHVYSSCRWHPGRYQSNSNSNQS